MNWGRAKTILIFMFLVTDIFLLIVLMQAHKQTLTIPKKTITETVKILSNNQIKVQAEQIPAKRVKSQNMIMQNFFQMPEETAKCMLGTDMKTIKSLPEQYEYQYEGGGGSLHIQGNGFSYRNKKVPAMFDVNQLPDNQRVSARIKESLHELGFSKETTFVYNIWEKDGLYHCDAMPMVDGEKIYGISMHITADSENILTLEGHWFETVEAEKNDPEYLMDVTAVLTGMALENQDGFEIADISHGYYTSDDFLNSREIAAIPIYIITDHTGQVRLYDARVGTQVE